MRRAVLPVCLILLQEATECTERYRELMRTVLRNPQLDTLQRDGGATLARLRKEATRLSSSPDVRYCRQDVSRLSPHPWGWAGLGQLLRLVRSHPGDPTALLAPLAVAGPGGLSQAPWEERHPRPRRQPWPHRAPVCCPKGR